MTCVQLAGGSLTLPKIGIWALLTLLACASLATAAEALEEPPVTDEDRQHWSFRPLQQPPLPPVRNAAWVRNEIDRFVAAELERRGWQPASQASRATLIRRLSFDLTGLPPTPGAVARFVADPHPSAYEQLVDRLLASPAYGRRWGQHWLDVARFAETDGFEHDKVRDQAWRYRDWVIAALNDDMPYDQFVSWQLAGDELQPDDPQARWATSFCLSGPDMPDINSQVERRDHLLNELTATVGSVLLGVQLGCAQCHDHKYDPISQADFYRLRAVFEPAVHVKKNVSVSTLQERGAKHPVSHLMVRGDWRRTGPQVVPAFPRIANPWNQSIAPVDQNAATSGRRRSLARWLTRPDHPLTTRVAANRLWQHHFGAGLSHTPNDFGLVGDEPSHLALLDWLACELPRRGWSLKAMHRLIVTSATYRQSSVPAAGYESAAVKEDPDNRWLSRYPRRRLEAEAIRDAMLSAAGVLNHQQGGAGVRPPLPAELQATLLKNQWRETPDRSQHDRRSVYLFARRNLRFPVLDVFDRPDANASCPVRNQSTTALQSLEMLNSDFALQTARRMAALVASQTGGKPTGTARDRQVELVWRRALGRHPDKDERRLALEFLTEQIQHIEQENARKPIDAKQLALADLCLAVLNSSEFVYVE